MDDGTPAMAGMTPQRRASGASTTTLGSRHSLRSAGGTQQVSASAAKRRARALAATHGHDVAPFNHHGQATCRNCAAVLLEEDAAAHARYSDRLYLGIFLRKCVPGPGAPYS